MTTYVSENPRNMKSVHKGGLSGVSKPVPGGLLCCKILLLQAHQNKLFNAFRLTQLQGRCVEVKLCRTSICRSRIGPPWSKAGVPNPVCLIRVGAELCREVDLQEQLGHPWSKVMDAVMGIL